MSGESVKIMQYQVTWQYARDKEQAFAEFSERADALTFINQQSVDDIGQNRVRIFRLYEHGRLVTEYQLDRLSIPCARAQYASGDYDLPMPFAEPFRLLRASLENQQQLIAKFITLADAKQCAEALFKTHPTTYLILNGQQFVEKIDTTSTSQQAAQQASQQRMQSKATFRPTPFMTQLRMGPPNWLQDEPKEDDSNDDKGE